MGLFSIFKKNKEKKQEAKKYLVGMEKTRKSAFSRLTSLFKSHNTITDELFDDDTVTESEIFLIGETFKKIRYYIPFYIKHFRSPEPKIEDIERELRIMYSTIKYTIKLDPNLDPHTIIGERYYYMLLQDPSLINGLLMSPDFMKSQKKYNKTLARKVFNRIVEKGLFNINAYSINHQLILRYVFHTKKDYLKYIPYHIWTGVEQELHYQDEPEMKLYGGKPKEDNKTTRSGISTFAYLLLALVFMIIIVIIVVVLFIKTKPLIQSHISITE